jgi:penicillin-binding protein 1C
VCAYSGHVASDACPHRTTALARSHAVPTARCPYHYDLEVDSESGLAVVPSCRVAGRTYERKTFVVLPSAVAGWLADRRRSLPEAPQFDPACTAAIGAAPTLTSPAEGQVVTLIPGLDPSQQRVALAASASAGTLSWFVDGAHIATAPSAERIYWEPTPGNHDIVVADAMGRKARRKLVVR